MPVDKGSALYGTPESSALRNAIRAGVFQAPSPTFDQAVSEIYRLERAAEAAGVNLGQADIRGAGTSVS